MKAEGGRRKDEAETLVRFEVWGPAHEWRGSGRIDVMTATPAEMTGEAIRRLAAAGLLYAGDKFRVWQPQGFSAEGTMEAGDMRRVSLSAKITDRDRDREQPTEPRA